MPAPRASKPAAQGSARIRPTLGVGQEPLFSGKVFTLLTSILIYTPSSFTIFMLDSVLALLEPPPFMRGNFL